MKSLTNYYVATFISVLLLLMPSPCSADSPTPKDTLRVMVWNVLHGANDVTNARVRVMTDSFTNWFQNNDAVSLHSAHSKYPKFQLNVKKYS